MANPENIVRAFFKVEGTGEKVEVHFNPESLQFTITSNLKNQGSGNLTKQYVSKSTGKLTMELIFDSTDTGEDIRLKTSKIANFMGPKGKDDDDKNVPPTVNFEWGLYTFKGVFESYKETLDFFSSDGVPLRAAVSVSMAGQDEVTVDAKCNQSAAGGDSGLPNSSIPATANGGKAATDLATKAGNPCAAKAIASFNGMESMRFPGPAPIEVDASVSLQGPAGFVSVGGSIDLGGDFSDLQATINETSTSLKLGGFLKADTSASLGLDASSIGLGGETGLQGSASLKADVGAAGALKGRIEFDGG